MSRSRYIGLTFSAHDADTLLEMDALGTDPMQHTVETLTDEIGRIVAERQELRARGAGAEDLEANRRRLAAAQAQLSTLLIARHLAEAAAA